MTPERDTLRDSARQVARILTEAGHQALFAGGCVRDALLGRTPSDYDVATSARPEAVLQLFSSAKCVGAHFGVVIVRSGEHDIEVATFRKDGAYSDGRHPDAVIFSSAEEDALRRDFTVNGLFQDPLKDEVIDYVGGRNDLKDRVIRAIGDPEARFSEDHLRLLRAVRFATVLDFAIETGTWDALRKLAASITTVSVERIRDELSKIWMHPNRLKGFDLLVESGLMQVLLPEIMTLRGCEQPPQFHPEGDVFVHTRLMLGLLPNDASLPLALSVLFHDIGKPATQTTDETGRIRFNGHDKLGAEMSESILRRLKYPNQVIEAVAEAVLNHMVFKDVPKMRTSKLKRFMARPNFDDELELHRVDCLGSHGGLDNYDFVNTKKQEFASEPLIPKPLINGNDLMGLGWKAGPGIGSLLTTVQNLQLEGVLGTREEALDWIRAHASPESGADAESRQAGD